MGDADSDLLVFDRSATNNPPQYVACFHIKQTRVSKYLLHSLFVDSANRMLTMICGDVMIINLVQTQKTPQASTNEQCLQ